MTPLRKRLLVLAFALGLPALVLLLSGVTQWVFRSFEGRPLSFHEALLFTVETLSTTGYGELTPLSSPITTGWAIFLITTGFAVIFVGVATIASRWLADRFQQQLPRRANNRLAGHVVICGAGPVARFLAEELALNQIPHLLLHNRDEALAELAYQGHPVVVGDCQDPEVLQAAGIERCRAVVTALTDPENASVALVARSIRPELRLCSTVEHAANEEFLRAAGVTEVVLAKQSLGERLGRLAVLGGVAGHFDQIRQRIEGLAVVAVPILPGSSLVGKSLQASQIRSQSRAMVLGIWSYGHFYPALDPSLVLRAGNVLIVAGRPESLEALRTQALGRLRPVAPGPGECLLLGYGDVGTAAAAQLRQARLPYRVLSLDSPAGIQGEWIQGDATQKQDLIRAGIQEVRCCIVALNDDSRAVFATLMARQLNPGLRILARANTVEAVSRLYLAGADNVLSVSEVAGVHLARSIAPRQAAPPSLEELVVEEMPVPAALAGRSLVQARVGPRTGCLVLAIHRAEGQVEATPEAASVARSGDRLVLFGTRENLGRFREQFGAGETAG